MYAWWVVVFQSARNKRELVPVFGPRDAEALKAWANDWRAHTDAGWRIINIIHMRDAEPDLDNFGLYPKPKARA